MPAFMSKPCVGPSCPGCSSGRCMAEGGMAESRYERDKGTSSAGADVRSGNRASDYSKHPNASSPKIEREMARDRYASAKQKRQDSLESQRAMKKPNLYAEGGRVGDGKQRIDFEKGVHPPKDEGSGESHVGDWARSGDSNGAKWRHGAKLQQMREMPKPKLMAEGGKVGSGKNRHDFERGINKPAEEVDDSKYGKWQRRSEAGSHIAQMDSPGVRARSSESSSERNFNEKNLQASKDIHHKTLGQAVSMKKPNLYAEGGEVEGPHEDHKIDEEMHGMMGEELMSALDSKDKKRIMESLEAIVLQCMNKE